MNNVLEFWVNAVGVGAGLCSMSSFIPQIFKIVRERDASGVSLGMFWVTASAFVLWTLYGVMQGSWPVTLSNAVCLTMSIVIVALRLKFGDGAAAEAAPS